VALKSGLQPDSADRQCGRFDRHGVVAAGRAYGQARIWFAMSRDRLLPGISARCIRHFERRISARGSRDCWLGFPQAVGHRHVCRVDQHRNVVRLHHRRGQRDRPAQKTAGSSAILQGSVRAAVPILSIICCLILMMGLPLLTWIRFIVWLLIGLVIYFVYSRNHTGNKLAVN